MKTTLEPVYIQPTIQKLYKEVTCCKQKKSTLNIKVENENAYQQLERLFQPLAFFSQIYKDYHSLYSLNTESGQVIFIDLLDVPYHHNWKDAIYELQYEGVGLVLISNELWVSYVADEWFCYEQQCIA